MLKLSLSLLKRILVVIVSMRVIGYVADMYYLYHVLAFLGVAIAPIISSQYFMPYLLDPTRFYSDLLGRGMANSGSWTPPPWLLMFLVKHVSMLIWLYFVSKFICKLFTLKACGKDVPAVDSFYARQLTLKAYAVYWVMQIPFMKALIYLVLPFNLPFHKYLISGLPMAIVSMIFLARGCLPAIYQAVCR